MTPATGYHAHLYWTGREQRALANDLRAELVSKFGAVPGTRRESAGGPHPAAEIHVSFGLEAFGEVVPWLMVNRGGLSVLVHPQTGDALADHTTHALWLGPPLTIVTDAL
jgi:aromatic ring-cleaving dioxygenase